MEEKKADGGPAISVRVMPVTDADQVTAKLVADKLVTAGMTVGVDLEGTLGSRIRAWQGGGVEPLCAIVNTTPMLQVAVGFRTRRQGDAGAVTGLPLVVPWLSGFAAGWREGASGV